MIELLEQCVCIPSLSRQEAQVAAFLRDEMQQRGFNHAFIDDAGNAVGILGDGPKQIVMLGHMDTVGGDVPVRYEDGKLFGRGSVDAKGPLCAFILAAQQFTTRNAPMGDWQIIVIGATEEEAASSKGARFAATQYAPAFCIIGEPSGMDGITLGYKGRLLVQARFEQSMREKQARYGESYPIDEDFLSALEIMPEASGVALGFDRLVMLAAGATRIDQVLWTPVA